MRKEESLVMGGSLMGGSRNEDGSKPARYVGSFEVAPPEVTELFWADRDDDAPQESGPERCGVCVQEGPLSRLELSPEAPAPSAGLAMAGVWDVCGVSSADRGA
jgi:hypothetical protein